MKLDNPWFVLDSYNQTIPNYSKRHGTLIGNWLEERVQRTLTGAGRTNGGRPLLRSQSSQCRTASPPPSRRDDTFQRVIGTRECVSDQFRCGSGGGSLARGQSARAIPSDPPLRRDSSSKADKPSYQGPHATQSDTALLGASFAACGGIVFDPAISLPRLRLHVKNSLEKKLSSSNPFGSLENMLGGPQSIVPISRIIRECCIDDAKMRDDLARILSFNSHDSNCIKVAHVLNILA